MIEQKTNELHAERIAGALSRIFSASRNSEAALGLANLDGREGGVEAFEHEVDAVVDRLRRGQAEREAFVEAIAIVSEGVVICDEVGRIIFENEQVVTWLHQPGNGDLATDALTQVLTLARSGQQNTRSMEIFGPPRRSLTFSGVPVFDSNHIAIGAICVLENTTERRHHEVVLRDFVANVSHELKTPIGALGLLAEALLVETDAEVLNRLTERLQVETARAGQVIEDLLNLSRIEDSTPLVSEQVEVGSIVTRALSRVRYVSEHRRIEIKVSVQEGIQVSGNETDLVSAVYNLLENAIKYSPDGATVEVTAASDGAWTEIAVADHGMGIASKYLDRIFERFYRVDDARTRSTGGTGLGLAIVRHVVQNHGGEVRVRSRVGEGSTFSLRLAAKPSVLTERLVIEGGSDG